MYRRLLSLFAALMLLVIGTLPANASAYGRVQVTDSTEAIYVEQSATDVDPAASTTDAFTKAGSSTKTVYIQRIELFFSQNTYLSPALCHLIKRSTLDSGGTSTDATAVPYDSGFSAASSTAMKIFTANPSSLGTEVGKIKSTWIWNDPGPIATQFNNTALHGGGGTRVLFDAQVDGGPIVLRGTSQNVAVNFGGAAPGDTGSRLGCRIVYREK